MARPMVDGILPLNKPRGVTSMDMVRLAKRVSRVRRVGHAGTLDPIATGVLPICFGQATRLMEHLVGGAKIYRGEVTIGFSTDTYDALGTVTEKGDPAEITAAEIERALTGMTGRVKQQPPMYSAIKHEGERLYNLARAGVEVDRPAREVTVHRVQLLAWDSPRAFLEVECGRGFYMRSLAHDLGIALDCPAHLSGLSRISAGGFSIDQTVLPEVLEDAGEDWQSLLVPPDAALLGLEPVMVPEAAERHLRNGQPVSLSGGSSYVEHLDTRRAYGADGRFLGILRFNRPAGQWQPEKVFSVSDPSPYAPAA